MAKRPSLAEGTQLGAYKIVRLIGRGGMGEVYEAYEERLHRKVALKIIAPERAQDHDADELIRRFFQEARTLARVNHPNVVTVYSIDRVDQIQFIAMELVDGISLKDLLKRFVLSADEAACLFIQLLEGLETLHNDMIVHRDLKPHNLVLRANGQIKLLDFGIAKRMNRVEDNLTHVGAVIGSVPYMPPEVRNGAAATPQSELWSVGAMLYECLVGEPLIKMQPDFVQGSRRSENQILQFPKESSIPQEMRAIVERLCARRLEDRYATCAQVIADLRSFQSHRPPLSSDVFLSLSKKIENLSSTDEHGGKSRIPLTALNAIKPVSPPPPSGPAISYRLPISLRPQKMLTGAAVIGIIALLVYWIVAPDESGIGRQLGGENGIVTDSDPQAVSPTGSDLQALSPVKGEPLWLTADQIPTLTWSKPVTTHDYEIQIASDPEFQNIVIREPASGRIYRPNRVIAEGHYYWRLVHRREQIAATNAADFTISYFSPLELNAPAPSASFTLKKEEERLNLDFAWTCKPAATAYLVQISPDPNFAKVLHESVGESCEWKDVPIEPGSYYWRVRVDEPHSQHQPWSVVYPFRIHSPPQPPAQPQPRPEPQLQTQTPPSLQPQPQPQHLTQKSRVKKAPTSNEPRPVRRPSESKRRATKPTTRKRVPGRTVRRELSAFTKDRHREESPTPAPEVTPTPTPAKERAQEKEPTLNLNPDSARDSDSISTSTSTSTSRSASTPTPMPTATSTPRPVPIALSEIPGPDIKTPPNKMSVPRPATGRLSVVFSWTALPRASGYIIEVASDPAFKNIIEKNDCDSPHWILKGAEFKGWIYWRVRANLPQGQSAWSKIASFQVREGTR
ncbi:MAG: serine/threonine-protein kinase [Bdellovibrionales bacterium]